jgi:hypothetical protein
MKMETSPVLRFREANDIPFLKNHWHSDRGSESSRNHETGIEIFTMKMNHQCRCQAVLCFTVIFLLLIFPGNAPAAQNRGNAISKKLLPKELANATVYDYFPESGEKEVASIEAKEGNVIIAKPDFKQAYFAATGDRLFEKDIVFTLKKSRCRFKLVTDDTVSMGAQSQISIKQVVDDRDNQSKSSLFGMAKGMATFSTVNVSRYFKQSMHAETQTAVSGVRGSKFGIEVRPAGGKPISAMPILLADASDGGFIYLAATQKEEGGNVTVVHSFEGQVEVKSTIDDTIQFLLPGMSIEATIRGLSKIFDTPAKAVEQFINSVEIKRQKAAKELEKKTEVVDKKMDDAGKKMEKKMEKDKPFGFMEKWGRDLEDKFKSNK